jgi:hypothetical protein
LGHAAGGGGNTIMLFPRKLPSDTKYEHDRSQFIRKSPGDERKDALVSRQLLQGLKDIEDKLDKVLKVLNVKTL